MGDRIIYGLIYHNPLDNLQLLDTICILPFWLIRLWKFWTAEMLCRSRVYLLD
jgi:hypothetical protein